MNVPQTRVVTALLLAALAVARPQGPCDIYAGAGTPCVAAHSTVRALYAAYDGPLYAVTRVADNATAEIRVDPATGYADAAAQRALCAGAKCEVERIFDQSPMGNHLDKVVPDPHHRPGKPAHGVDPMKEELVVGGHRVYSAYFEGNEFWNGTGTIGYRALYTKGVAQNDEPESMYAVVSGTHQNDQCCFDYGNAEGNPNETHTVRNDSDGKMEAIYFGSTRGGGGANSPGLGGDKKGSGPWVMADLEMGVWAGNKRGTKARDAPDHKPHYAVNARNTPINTTFVTAMLKGRPGAWALKHGDAQAGRLTTLFDGPRPPGYHTMQKQGAIVLGIGGDTSDNGVGTFYEGAMTANYTSQATDEAVQANIVAAGYGRGAEMIV